MLSYGHVGPRVSQGALRHLRASQGVSGRLRASQGAPVGVLVPAQPGTAIKIESLFHPGRNYFS